MMLRRSIAAVEVLLIFPGTLFMIALFVRNVQPAPVRAGADGTPCGGLVCRSPARRP